MQILYRLGRHLSEGCRTARGGVGRGVGPEARASRPLRQHGARRSPGGRRWFRHC